MVVTVDARAQAAAGEGVTVGHRVHMVRHGQGKTAWVERQETEVVGIQGLTTYSQYGTPEHGRHHNRRDFKANPIHAVVVRQWNGKDYGPSGKTVFLTNASVDKPLQPFDDYDDRSLIENCCIKEAKQQWDLGHPPQKTGRAVRGHVLFTCLMFALATAYRLHCEQAEGESRWVGSGGGANSSSRPGTRSSSSPSAGTPPFISQNSPCWWASSSKTCRQASGHPRKCWPSTGSPPMDDSYIGTSGVK
jgi:hypothetical protein